jgi:hypothetical protein
MKSCFRTFLLIVVLASLPQSMRALPGDEHWDKRFALPGVTNNVVFAIASNEGKLYAGGYLASGGNTNDVIQVWDGLQWSGFGFFTGSSSPPVKDMAFMGNTLFVAGSFTSVDGTAMRGVVQRVGNTWQSLGLTGPVQSLAVDNGKLYAAGAFTNLDASGVVMTNIGCWDGASWHALGGGVGNPGSGSLNAVSAKNGIVYAGGLFTNSGPTAMTNIASWNGSVWSPVGSGLGVSGSSFVFCLAFNGADLYAGGLFNNAGSTAATNIAHWDGANWLPVGTGLAGGSVNSMDFLNGSLCVAGNFNAAGSLHVTNFAVWNGSSWAAANAGINGNGYRVLGNGTNVYVGGNYVLAGNVVANGIAAWDGALWGQFGTPGLMNGVSSTAKALAGDGTNVYIGGSSASFKSAGTTNVNLVARFDGTNWYPLGSGITGPSGAGINALALDSSNNLYVGGYFSSAGGVAVQNIAQWNGASWSSLGDPGGAVAAITLRPDGIYAAGASYNGSVYNSTFFSRWDGSTWTNVLHFNPDDTFSGFSINDPNFGLAAVAFMGTNIYVGGHFYITWHDPTMTIETNCMNILRIDGTYARIVGTGLNSNVTSMAVLGTNLYVAGFFTNAGGIAANKLAMWDGSTWTSVGGSVVGNGNVNAMAAMGNYLYVGGTFTNMGGTPVNRVAKWDGANWYAMGSGVYTPGGVSISVSGLGVLGNDLFVAGNFRMAGNKAAYDFSRWNEAQNWDTPQLLLLPPNSAPPRIRLMGIPGLTNVIQATTNFTSWVPILTNSTGIYDFIDPDAANYRSRFYRSLLGP